MDGRAYSNPDDALVMEVCDSLEEARKNKNSHGDGCAIFIDGESEKDELQLVE